MDSQHVAPKRRLLPPPPPPCEAHLAQPEESSTFHTFHIPIQFTGGRQRMQKIEGRPNNIDRWMGRWMDRRMGRMDGRTERRGVDCSIHNPTSTPTPTPTPTHLPRAVHYVYVYVYVYIFMYIFIFMFMDNSIKRRKTTVYIYPRWLHRGTGERARVGCRRLRDR